MYGARRCHFYSSADSKRNPEWFTTVLRMKKNSIAEERQALMEYYEENGIDMNACGGDEDVLPF